MGCSEFLIVLRVSYRKMTGINSSNSRQSNVLQTFHCEFALPVIAYLLFLSWYLCSSLSFVVRTSPTQELPLVLRVGKLHDANILRGHFIRICSSKLFRNNFVTPSIGVHILIMSAYQARIISWIDHNIPKWQIHPHPDIQFWFRANTIFWSYAPLPFLALNSFTSKFA